VLYRPNIWRLWLIDHHTHIAIEKLNLQEDELPGPLVDGFAHYEVKDLQFGASWLANLAATALKAHEQGVVFVARLSDDDFVACPLKINSRNRRAESLSTFYSSNYSPVACSANPGLLLTAIFEHLARVENISTLTLSPLEVQSPLFITIQNALVASGWKGIHSFFCFGNWIHEVAGNSYPDYLASRRSQLRNTIKRRTRQFLEADRGKLQLIQGGDLLEAAIAEFVAVYNSSWKREEPYPNFIPELLRLSARRGWLRLGIASYDDKPVAGQIWLVWAGTAYIFKLAYHEDYGQLSPGTVLTAYIMQHVIEKDAVTRIDYLSGDDEYKKSWMSARRERHGIAAYNPRTLLGSGMILGRSLNSLLKRLRGKLSSTAQPDRKLRTPA
jgi:hypothetical protein